MDGTVTDPSGTTLQQDESPDSVAVVSHKDAVWWLCPMQQACICEPEGIAQR
jgi:hypothetical protein